MQKIYLWTYIINSNKERDRKEGYIETDRQYFDAHD